MPACAPGGERLSSAILYAAIVAIWAGVLIPRWLRRDSSASSSDAPDASGASGSFGSSGASGASGTSGEEAPDEAPGGGGDGPHPLRPRKRRGDGGRKRREDVYHRREYSDGRGEAPPDPGHGRALAARRRLLGLLVLLAAGSGALAGTRMAAWWVVVPPTVMLLGYLPLLRASARMDAERRVLAARQRRAGGQMADYSRDLVDPVTYVAHVAPVGDLAPAFQAEVPDIADDDEIYDQYTDAKLRAVGD